MSSSLDSKVSGCTEDSKAIEGLVVFFKMFQRFCCGNFSNPAVGQGDWQSFQFEVAFDAPPVVVILSTGFEVPENVQVRSVTATGFEALLEVPPGCTGGLPPVTALRLAFGMAGEVYSCGEKNPFRYGL